MGTLGKDIKSFIDTRKAGPGELNLHCVGPHGKTAYCELNDHQDGTFTLHLKPQVCFNIINHKNIFTFLYFKS
jgi:filamin